MGFCYEITKCSRQRTQQYHLLRLFDFLIAPSVGLIPSLEEPFMRIQNNSLAKIGTEPRHRQLQAPCVSAGLRRSLRMSENSGPDRAAMAHSSHSYEYHSPLIIGLVSDPARSPNKHVGALLRNWRTTRRLSQLDLALETGISSRHLSYLETGRAQPSRDMVLRLAVALQVPLSERNALLLAAGFAPLYRQTSLDALEMNHAKRAVEFTLAQQEPYPAIVVDQHWNILMRNHGATRFMALFPECNLPGPPNGIRLLFHPEGLRPFIENWEDLAARLIQRVHRETATNPSDEPMRTLLEELLAYPGVPSRWLIPNLEKPPEPFLTIDYRRDDLKIRLFSTIATFGTAQDLTLHGLRIESFFPADEATRAILTAL
jgi:transcriptional regulator with XRE-family HTH domain